MSTTDKKAITPGELKTILADHAKWLRDDLEGIRADLQGADLQYANLQEADLRHADLRHADLQNANLQEADLRYADLRHADLQNANLQEADLRYANLQHANLQYANLEGADLDYSCGWKFACVHSKFICDNNQLYQMLAHAASLECSEDATPEEKEEFQRIQAAILPFAKKSHRAEDLGIAKACDPDCKEDQ